MELKVRTSRKYEVVDLTQQIAEAVRVAHLDEGLCNVYVPHATAAIIINENDDQQIGLDLLDALDKLIPEGIWRHDQIDSNGAAHLKAAILGPSETIPVQNGRLALGIWQVVMLVELDGPRDRRVIVTVR
jgi:secondary thiamine-phosphate synthase enzyme